MFETGLAFGSWLAERDLSSAWAGYLRLLRSKIYINPGYILNNLWTNPRQLSVCEAEGRFSGLAILLDESCPVLGQLLQCRKNVAGGGGTGKSDWEGNPGETSPKGTQT